MTCVRCKTIVALPTAVTALIDAHAPLERLVEVIEGSQLTFATDCAPVEVEDGSEALEDYTEALVDMQYETESDPVLSTSTQIKSSPTVALQYDSEEDVFEPLGYED